MSCDNVSTFVCSSCFSPLATWQFTWQLCLSRRGSNVFKLWASFEQRNWSGCHVKSCEARFHKQAHQVVAGNPDSPPDDCVCGQAWCETPSHGTYRAFCTLQAWEMLRNAAHHPYCFPCLQNTEQGKWMIIPCLRLPRASGKRLGLFFHFALDLWG